VGSPIPIRWPFDPTVLSFHTDSAGALWIGTGNGLVVRRDQRFEYAIDGAALPGVRVLSITADSERNLWWGSMPTASAGSADCAVRGLPRAAGQYLDCGCNR
jgi:ligand-binding sensor domain-containing protein